jgi:molybdate transport system substrate-binding protein
MNKITCVAVTSIRVAFIAVALIAALASAAAAAEIKVLCSNGLRAVVEELVPQFERKTGNKIVLKFEPSTAIQKRIEAGEAFDVAVMTTALVDQEIKAGRLAADSRTIVARSGLGLSVRAGSKKSDIASVDAFKKALLSAKSITYATQGASAAPFETLVAKLGIAAEVKPKYRLRDTASQVGEVVADGTVEIGVAPVSEILPVKGVELVGPFPADIQSYVVMTAALNVKGQERGAAKGFVDFLMAPANLPVIKAKGMER